MKFANEGDPKPKDENTSGQDVSDEQLDGIAGGFGCEFTVTREVKCGELLSCGTDT